MNKEQKKFKKIVKKRIKKKAYLKVYKRQKLIDSIEPLERRLKLRLELREKGIQARQARKNKKVESKYKTYRSNKKVINS